MSDGRSCGPCCFSLPVVYSRDYSNTSVCVRDPFVRSVAIMKVHSVYVMNVSSVLDGC